MLGFMDPHSTLDVRHSGSVRHEAIDSMSIEELRQLAGAPTLTVGDRHELPPGHTTDTDTDGPDSTVSEQLGTDE